MRRLMQIRWRTIRDWLRAADLRVLIAGLIVVAGAWCFIELAGEVAEGDTRAFDEWALRALRDPADLHDPIGPHWFEGAVRDVTSLGGFVVLTLISSAAVGFLLICRQTHAVLLVLVALLGGVTLSMTLKDWHARPRPSVVPHLADVSDPSFPSGHAMLSAVVYLTLGSLLTRFIGRVALKVYVLSIAFLLTALVGMSRIYLGVHYPTDVLAGWSVGLAWALLCWLAGRYLQQRGAVEQPSAETS